MVYRERLHSSLNFKLLFGSTMAVCVLLALASLMAPFQLWMLIVGIILFIVSAFIFFAYRVLTFEVTAEQVRFGFPVYHKAVPRNAVLSCEPCELKFPSYLGWGIRQGPEGRAFQVRNGPAVRLAIEGAPYPYCVSLDDPEAACRALHTVSPSS